MGVQIVGHRVEHEYGYGGWTGDKTDVSRIVATFDYKKDALAYIKDSRLKNPSNKKRPFKQKSLLSFFEDAEIEEITYNDPPPHNPSMKTADVFAHFRRKK